MSDGNVDVTSKDVFVMIIRYLLCLIFPPLAVFDKGCGTMLLVFLFTLFGWLPGTAVMPVVALFEASKTSTATLVCPAVVMVMLLLSVTVWLRAAQTEIPITKMQMRALNAVIMSFLLTDDPVF